VTKLGEGTLALTGTNTHTGLTSVDGGTLLVDGSIAGDVTVAAGAVLSGRGSIGRLTVASGGVFSPGASPGILTIAGDLELAAGSTYLVDLAGTTAGTQYDQTVVMGAVSLADAVLSVNLGFLPAGGDLFAIVLNDGTDPIIGSFLGLAEGATLSASNHLFTISYLGGTGNDVVLRAAAPVPEPATLLATVMGLLLLGWIARRQGR
jgi:autotransporter-associated beta strand protein